MSNTLTNVLPTILARGGLALRQNAIMARLVYRDLESYAMRAGNVITVPIPSAVVARAVTPGVVWVTASDVSPTANNVTLDSWYEAPFYLNDNDKISADPMILPMEASEAIKALGNKIDSSILASHVGFFGYTGTPGTTPFQSSLSAAFNAKKILTQNLASIDGRVAVIDPSAEFYLGQNSQVLQSEQRGDSQGIINGTIGRKIGFDWYVDQNITTFTPGTGWVTGFTVSTTTGVSGASTLHILNATASGSILIGDVFTLGSDSKQYVVTANATASATVGVDISIYPPLSAAASLGTTLAVVQSAYTVNMAFHPLGWAFASRPFNSDPLGVNFQLPVDPVSGVALRLEVARQYKQTMYSYDALWGQRVIRRELGCKILG